MRQNKNKKRRKKPAIKTEKADDSYLACGHHRVMITSLALLEGFLNSGKAGSKVRKSNIISLL